MILHFVSASDGTNVVRAFEDAIRAALAYRETTSDVMDHIMEELEVRITDGINLIIFYSLVCLLFRNISTIQKRNFR